MPKTYSDKEKERIIKSLKDVASVCMLNYGVKKTTVDEIVKRVGIPKGTFYLFYKSKELLLFDAIMEVHERIEKELLIEFQSTMTNITIDSFTTLILNYFLKVSDTCLYKVILNGEINLLICKLPDEVVTTHLAHDEDYLEKILGVLQVEESKIKEFSGGFRGIFLVLQFQREIGEYNFVQSIELMIRGLVMQMMEGKDDTSK